MRYIEKMLLILLLMGVAKGVLAVTLIEIKEAEGAVSKMYFEGSKVRVDTSSEPGYVIIDTKNNSMLVVSHAEKKIIDMGGIDDDESDSYQQPLDIKFVSKGAGPKVAGYPTSHYELVVNGHKCSDDYLNKQIAKDLGIEKILEKMPSGGSAMQMMEDMGVESDPCLMAESKISGMYARYGYPLRSVRANGELDSEVVRVSKKAKMPQGGFGLPKGYQRVDMAEMMRGMQQQLQNMPELTPEGMKNIKPEQLQQMQDMMQQMMKKMGQPGE